MNKVVKIAQLWVAYWDGDKGRRQHTLIGLTHKGDVYRYEVGVGGWVKLNMHEVQRPSPLGEEDC